MRSKIIASFISFVTILSFFFVFANENYTVYPKFSKISALENAYPAPAEGFVPQGITSPVDSDVVIVCGYMEKDLPSRIYVYRSDADPVCISLKNEDGSVYSGHAGGITAAGKFVYVSNAHKLFVLRLDDVLSASDGDALSFIGSVDVDVNASYCSSDDENVYVGEYHADGYETDESHSVDSADGTLHSFTRAYKLVPSAPLGLAEPTEPVMTFAARDSVQGFSVLPDNKIALSCSRGFKNSRLYIYDVSDADFSSPVILDKTRLDGEITMPRISEDLELRGEKLLVGFESGAKKFGRGLLPFTVKKTVAIDVEALYKII